MAGNIHGHQEAFARAVGHSTMQVLTRSKGNRMEGKVESSPLALDGLEHGFQLPFLANIARKIERWRNIKNLGQGLRELPGFLIQVGDAQLRTEAAKCLSTAPGDGLVVGNAEDNSLLAGQWR